MAKKCNTCNITKCGGQFSKRLSHFKKYVLRNQCKTCVNSYYKKHSKIYPESHRKANSKYAKNNRNKRNFINTKHEAAKLQRTPAWLTKSDWIEIQWAYKIAQEMTKETGVIYEVDHIIPLQGKNISGLHCPQNLQILTKSQNSSKGNRFGS